MATIKIYKSSDWNYYLEVTYSVAPGTFTLEKIVGYVSGTIYYGGGNDPKNHYIRLPDGNVFGFSTGKGTGAYYNGQYYGTGYGVSPNGMTWQLSPITFFCKEGSTGLISIQNYQSSIDYNYEGNFDAQSNITIPYSITAPTLTSLNFTDISYNSAKVSYTITNKGGRDITYTVVGIKEGEYTGGVDWYVSTTMSDNVCSATLTDLKPNTSYSLFGFATNHPDGQGRTDYSYETYVWGSFTTSNIEPPRLKDFNIKSLASNKLSLNYTLPDSMPKVNKLFGWIQINDQQIRKFDSTIPEILEWRYSSRPGAENDPCFVFKINDTNSITIEGFFNQKNEKISLKEGDKIKVWLLTSVDYDDQEYFVDGSWFNKEISYQSAPWIFISPFGKSDYEEVEMIILDGQFKTKIQGSNPNTQVVIE